MVDEAHGVGVLGARGAGHSRAARRRGPTSTCGWARSRSRSPPAAGFIAGPAEVIEFLRISARPFLFTASAVPAAVGAALAAVAHLPLGRGPASCSPACSTTRATCTAACTSSASTSSSRRRCRTARPSSPRSSRSSSATTGRRRCCGGRSTTPASTSTSRSIPAVPPGGALLRTSVMATHEPAVLDRALDAFAAVKRDLRGRARTAAGAGQPSGPELVQIRTNRFAKKNPALSERLAGASPLTLARSPGVAWPTARQLGGSRRARGVSVE